MVDVEGQSQGLGFEKYAALAQEAYKKSRSEVGRDEGQVKRFSRDSAVFGEMAFRLAPAFEEDRRMVEILGRDVTNAYFIAERYKDTLRFSADYLAYLGTNYPTDAVPRNIQSIVDGIGKVREACLDKLSANWS